MKKLGLLAATLLLVSFIILCSATVRAQATADTSNEIVPFDLEAFIPCANNGAGEVVTFSGELHILVHSVSNGNTIRVSEHFQPVNLSGVGADTGDIYRATGVTMDSLKTSSAGAQVFDFVNNFRLIGQGPGNNLLVHSVNHVTIDANGNITSDVTNSSVDCK